MRDKLGEQLLIAGVRRRDKADVAGEKTLCGTIPSGKIAACCPAKCPVAGRSVTAPRIDPATLAFRAYGIGTAAVGDPNDNCALPGIRFATIISSQRF
jgi:hypothetical protein